jgi:hypothetical protein
MPEMKSKPSRAGASRRKVRPKPDIARPVASGARLIPFKPGDKLAGPVGGVPDLVGTRLTCFCAALICLAFAIGLLATIVLFPIGDGSQFVIQAVLLLVVAVLIGLAAGLVRAGRRVGAFFIASPSGIRYGADGDIDTLVEWERITPNQAAPYDVRLILDGAPHSLKRARIAFWYRLPDGRLEERSLPLSLSEKPLRCIRFLNADAVRIALLKGMAARRGLRFHPDIFVEAGVDPATWQPMPKPSGMEWAIVLGSLALGLALGGLTVGKAPLVATTAAVLAPLGLGVLMTTTFRKEAYPDFGTIICFRPDSEEERT